MLANGPTGWPCIRLGMLGSKTLLLPASAFGSSHTCFRLDAMSICALLHRYLIAGRTLLLFVVLCLGLFFSTVYNVCLILILVACLSLHVLLR